MRGIEVMEKLNKNSLPLTTISLLSITSFLFHRSLLRLLSMLSFFSLFIHFFFSFLPTFRYFFPFLAFRLPFLTTTPISLSLSPSLSPFFSLPLLSGSFSLSSSHPTIMTVYLKRNSKKVKTIWPS